jgi:hypothetical protein
MAHPEKFARNGVKNLEYMNLLLPSVCMSLKSFKVFSAKGKKQTGRDDFSSTL